MAEYVLDTVVIQVMTFSDPDGIAILLQGLEATKARFPAEVYNQDENALSLDTADDELSEFARGLRYAARQVHRLPAAEGQRYATWLQNARQLSQCLTDSTLVIDPLSIEELQRRENLMAEFGIGRGEAACLTLVERYQAQGVFLSSDDEACQIAQQLGISYTTLPEILERWVARAGPDPEQLERLVAGMRAAKFGLKASVLERLRRILEAQE